MRDPLTPKGWLSVLMLRALANIERRESVGSSAQPERSESMYPSPSRRIRALDNRTTHTALCRDDHCPWKHRGATADETWRAAEEHALTIGHGVRLYSETTTDLERKSEPSEIPDRRCGCGPNITQVECPYHGGAI